MKEGKLFSALTRQRRLNVTKRLGYIRRLRHLFGLTEAQARLTRYNGKWHVIARRGVETAAEAVWVSLGGCLPCQATAIRIWLACVTMGKR